MSFKSHSLPRNLEENFIFRSGIYGGGSSSEAISPKMPPKSLFFKDGESKMVAFEDIADYLKDGWEEGTEDLFLLTKALEDCKDPEEQAKLKKTFLEKVLAEGAFGVIPPFKDQALEEELFEKAIRLEPRMILFWWNRVFRLSNFKTLITIACEDKSVLEGIPAYFIEKNPKFWFRYKCTIKENNWDIKKPQKR